MKKSILFSSCGRRAQLLKYCRETLGNRVRIIAADMDRTAPALYYADAAYVVPPISDSGYVERLLDICEAENVGIITTLIDPEIELLAKHKSKFDALGVLVLVPDEETAKITYDKLKFSYALQELGIRGIKSFQSLDDCLEAVDENRTSFPLFIKPNTGSGNSGARKINSRVELENECAFNRDIIIQEYIEGTEVDLDMYVDPFSLQPVAMFSKEKLEIRPGGTSKSVSFKDEALFKLASEIASKFKFCGPTDLEFFRLSDGEYILIEINPRFSGAYLHAFACGVDFFSCMEKNLNGSPCVAGDNSYEEGLYMFLYDTVLAVGEAGLIGEGQ